MRVAATLLIADRNPHVRDFLKRELEVSGYRTRQAKDGRDLIRQIFSSEDVDLLILDPDLPDIEERFLLTKLRDRIPPMTIVIHELNDRSDSDYPEGFRPAARVEKRGSSVECLKQVVRELLVSTRGL